MAPSEAIAERPRNRLAGLAPKRLKASTKLRFIITVSCEFCEGRPQSYRLAGADLRYSADADHGRSVPKKLGQGRGFVVGLSLARYLLACLAWPLAPPKPYLPAKVRPPRKVFRTGRQAFLPISIFFREIYAVTKLYVGNLPFSATED